MTTNRRLGDEPSPLGHARAYNWEVNQGMTGANEHISMSSRALRPSAMPWGWVPLLLLVCFFAVMISPSGLAQRASTYPVYVPDSPTAEEALNRAVELSSAGGLEEAVRVLQRVLDEQGDSVTASRHDPDLFIPLRQAVNAVLLERPELLARYRTMQGATARALLAGGAIDDVERTRLLTEAGFDAALQHAQAFLEDARFKAAWLTIEQLDKHPDRVEVRARQAARLLELISAYMGPRARDAGF
jgi:hypothetical protein